MPDRCQWWVWVSAAGIFLSLGCAQGASKLKSGAPYKGTPLFAATTGGEGKSLTTGPERLSEVDLDQRVRAHAHFATGLSHDLNDRPEDALKEYLQAISLDPANEPLAMDLARRLLRNRQPEAAVDILTKASKSPSASGNVFAFLGLALAHLGRNDEAIAANKTALEKIPESLIPYQNLAQIYLQNNRTNEARQILDQAARHRGTDAVFLADLIELYSRLILLPNFKDSSVIVRMREVMERLADLKPTNELVLQKLAEGYHQLGEFAKAEEIYLQLLQQHPDVPILRRKLIEIYLRTGDRGKAAEQLKAVSREDPTNPQNYYFLGALSLEDNQPEQAVEYFEKALLLNPDLEPLYYELAGLKLNLRKPQEAWAILERARRQFKLGFAMEFYSGVTQAVLKNYSQAVIFLTSAELLAKTSEPERLNHHFYFQLGSAYERSGDHAGAERAFRKALELSPDFAEALNYLGYMWADKGVNLDEAKTMIEKAVALEPENAAFLDSLGWVFFKLKRPEEALKWLLKAIDHSEEPDPTLQDHLGDIYAALGKKDLAVEAWKKSLSLEPNDQVKSKLETATGAPAAPASPTAPNVQPERVPPNGASF